MISLFLEIFVLFWRAVESFLAIPQHLRHRLEQDWGAWKKNAALEMVLSTAWPEGFDPKPLARQILAADEVELVDWVYGDRSIRAHLYGGDLLVVHRQADGVYTVTDLSEVQNVGT